MNIVSSKPISFKQIRLIQRITSILNISFNGSTSKQASQFIIENIVEFRKAKRIDEAYAHIQYSEHGFID
ncbi:hypothetical protein EKG37_21270 [Robertmurraya yapensis]|uniref:Uncharacterized protein n=1 Tax=Bacillus yapensis TaxID=2492960 RepID=A0A431VTM8_9BACI|nr:hypothetical protein [Bacillus yapensis]RTR26602.1 hypothetical protein EKG37_21270 [Bacillus yapensis]TKS93777.1 hypothetical protein FAR12_21275 [Bacillus yapensis]